MNFSLGSAKLNNKRPTRVSAKASTLPKDSILVKSGPSPVITMLTETPIFHLQVHESIVK
uniref:Uncharacterized protein n=1 Tax=Rhizophora mucronata TaxID=61149 RepID=A0A2P2LF46_RHIMU